MRVGLSDPQGDEVLEPNPKSSFLKGNGGPRSQFMALLDPEIRCPNSLSTALRLNPFILSSSTLSGEWGPKYIYKSPE